MPFATFETEAFKRNLDPEKLTPRRLLIDVPGGAPGDLMYVEAFNRPLVRRPLNGLAIKERTSANLTILDGSGQTLMLNNSVGHLTQEEARRHGQFAHGVSHESAYRDKYYTDFVLLQVHESREEKVQIAETFGEEFVFFFGERARLLACAGILINSLDFTWRAQFWENYDKHLRGTKLVEQKARAYLSFDDIVVEGYLLSADAIDRADEPHSIPFNFSMLVTGYISLADLNGALIANATAHSRETVGSLGSEVTSNGQPVRLGDGFWQHQLNLLTGGDPFGALNTAAQTALVNPSSFNYQAPLAQAGNLPAAGLGLANFGKAAPLKNVMLSETQAVGQAGAGSAVAGNADRFAPLAKTVHAKKVFGKGFQSTHSMVRIKSGV